MVHVLLYFLLFFCILQNILAGGEDGETAQATQRLKARKKVRFRAFH